MAIPIITYIPLVAGLIEHACGVVTKHRAKIQEVAELVYPGHTAEVNANLDAIVAGCAFFNLLIDALRAYQASH